MPALGHKQTYAMQKGMSALPLKADIGRRAWNVRPGQEADIRAIIRATQQSEAFRAAR